MKIITRRPAAFGCVAAIAVTLSAAQAPTAALVFPSGLTLSPDGRVVLADRGAHYVFSVDPATGAAAILAGTGTPGFSGDGGPARAAAFRNPEWVEHDPAGNLVIADRGNRRVRRVDRRTGIVTTIFGTGQNVSAGDGGPATAASTTNPFGLTHDREGDLYVFDTEAHSIRRISAASGLVERVIGNGQPGFSGDGGQATAATLNRPHNGVFDAEGRLVFGDSFNQRIRRWEPRNGVVTTVAGIGQEGVSPDGTPADQSKFAYFGAMTWLGSDLIFTSGHLILRLDSKTQMLHRIAGDGNPGDSGDGGPATAAQLRIGYGIVVTRDGHVVFADAANRRLRRIDMKTGLISTLVGPVLKIDPRY